MKNKLKDLPIGPSSEAQVPAQQYLDLPRIIPAYVAGRLSIIPDCEDHAEGMERIRKAIGANSSDFVNEMLVELAEVATRNGVTSLQKLNFLVSVVTEIKPRDAIEAMFASQMAVIHVRAMKLAEFLANARTPKEEQHHEYLLNKCLRTFVALVDGLERYRSRRNVIVGEGAQALVANVAQNECAQREPTKQSLVPATDARPLKFPIMSGSEDRILAAKKYDWRS
jgi:hypothetical protein